MTFEFLKKIKVDAVDILLLFALVMTLYYFCPLSLVHSSLSTSFKRKGLVLGGILILIGSAYIRRRFFFWSVILKKEVLKYPVIGGLSGVASVLGVIFIGWGVNELVSSSYLKAEPVDKAAVTKEVQRKAEQEKLFASILTNLEGAKRGEKPLVDEEERILKAVAEAESQALQDFIERKERRYSIAERFLLIGTGLMIFSIGLSWLRNRLS